MSWVDWIGGNERSSLFKEVVEFSVFFSGVVVLSGLVGNSGDSDIDFSEFFEGQSFSWSDFLFFGFGLFSEVNKKLL